MTERRRILGFHAPRVHRVRAPLRGRVAPCRVVQLTDLHFGLVTPEELLVEAVARTNAARPDLVALTGDFICRGTRFIGRITEVLSALDAPAVAVLGNHDHWVAGDAVRRALERAGVVVLQNRWTAMEIQDETLWIAGMDDSTTGNHDPGSTVRGLPEGPVLGLTHNPAAAPLLWEQGVCGVLSGHTHSGQVHVRGITRPFYRRVLGQPFVDGLHQTARGWVYVSAGVGSSAIPWRAGAEARREVSVLELGPG